ncbi:NAD(P)-dependent oxidoreductase [uncultured Methanospirillum sp.]|uniref:NAD-dependent epimerase/dehydratase family protein n=1 Tax=uncultured Methanospirillum sp. TaxID=262503 RepID=UPI0029C7066F|nr:NAD(P)-dependent oxidoreductase [uncultured Methanospirillum sp.]
MKIVVTGATGFIGRHVVNWLVEKNQYEIIASGTSAKKASTFSWYNKVKFLPCDYYEQNIDYYTYFEKPDLLIHLAWKGLPNYSELFHLDENLPFEMRFLKSFSISAHTKIVVAGTCFEYGLVNGCLSEDLVTNPVTVYGIAKDTLQKYLVLLTKKNSNQWNWIRLFFMYGPGQNPKSLLPLLDAAIQNRDTKFSMSGGEQLRDYLPVETVANNICQIAIQNKINGIVNCCSGNPISVRNLVEKHKKERHSQIALNFGEYPYPEYEPMAFWGNNSKLLQILQ